MLLPSSTPEPVSGGGAAPRRAQAEQEGREIENRPEQQQRLLVVDDEPAFGAFVKDVAENEGFAVEVTAGAEAFKQALTAFAPTIVAVDIVMPDIDGIELLQHLAESNWVGPVLVISGYNPDYLRLAKALGGSRGLPNVVTLTKPIRAKELRSALLDAARAGRA